MSGLSVKWYGLNALEIRHSGGSFMIDPYVSRSREKLHVCSEADKYLTSKPDFVLMTHAHWDHLPDVPHLIRRSPGTRLYASKTACNIMRALEVPEENLCELVYGKTYCLPGNVKVTALESRHMGMEEPAPGYAEVPDRELLRESRNWLCGETFAFMMELDGMKLLDLGSANICKETMSGSACDYLLCGISRYKEGFPEILQKHLSFKCLIPTHHDEFTLPLDQFFLRNDLQRLLQEIPGLTYRELPLLQWSRLSTESIM